MTEPYDRFENHSAILRDLIDKAGNMTVEAATRADADNFGIDARISTAHKFVDLEVKGHVELLENLIAGPWWLGPVPAEARPSDPLDVDPATYPRKIEPAEAYFTRVGQPGTKLPATALRFLPAVLPANATQFRVALTDYHYVGANYRGKVKLTPTSMATGSQVPAEYVVVVGL
jgi:hypothetical protein